MLVLPVVFVVGLIDKNQSNKFPRRPVRGKKTMDAHKIILTAFLSFLICTAAAGKSAPDISVTVVTEDDRGNRGGVPAVAVAVTDDNGTV